MKPVPKRKGAAAVVVVVDPAVVDFEAEDVAAVAVADGGINSSPELPLQFLRNDPTAN